MKYYRVYICTFISGNKARERGTGTGNGNGARAFTSYRSLAQLNGRRPIFLNKTLFSEIAILISEISYCPRVTVIVHLFLVLDNTIAMFKLKNELNHQFYDKYEKHNSCIN